MNFFSPVEIKKKLSVRPMFEIISLLNIYCNTVSQNIKSNGIEQLKNFVNSRMYRHIDYFSRNDIIISFAAFKKNALDKVTY